MLVAEASYGANSSGVSGPGLIGKKNQPPIIFCWSPADLNVWKPALYKLKKKKVLVQKPI